MPKVTLSDWIESVLVGTDSDYSDDYLDIIDPL